MYFQTNNDIIGFGMPDFRWFFFLHVSKWLLGNASLVALSSIGFKGIELAVYILLWEWALSWPFAYPLSFSVFASQDTRTQGHAEIRPSRKGYNNDQSGFRIEIPIKSAPTSPLSSPGLSPRRQSVGDVLTYHYVVPQGNQVWSAPEMPTGDIIGGHHPPFFDYTVFSNDSSPLNSPQGRSTCQNPRSPGSTSPLHSKLSFETSTPRREGSASLEVHPLPLPPGAVISSPTVPIPQVTAKPESLPLKSQWQKGKLIGRGTFGSVYVASNRSVNFLSLSMPVSFAFIIDNRIHFFL